ncbi:MAG: hypothetical protein HY537_03125 [Deltaproteobacteria bacterium]|nr:hypothetical protein [Deltaproteobacteria bacterium]
MASPKQMKANRDNAVKSSGPISTEGKAIVARNAITHGLFSSDIVLPDEDATDFCTFRGQLITHLGPVGIAEELFADRVTSCAWRLRRLIRFENFHLSGGYLGIIQSPGEIIGSHFADETLHRLSRYEAAIERSLYRALHELQRLQMMRLGQPVPPPVVLEVGISTLRDDAQ